MSTSTRRKSSRTETREVAPPAIASRTSSRNANDDSPSSGGTIASSPRLRDRSRARRFHAHTKRQDEERHPKRLTNWLDHQDPSLGGDDPQGTLSSSEHLEPETSKTMRAGDSCRLLRRSLSHASVTHRPG